MSLASTNFSERLSRIESSQKRLKGGVVLHVGDSEVNVRSISELRRVVAKPKPAVRFRPFAVIGAPLVGALGLVGALALRERFLTPELADTIKDHPDLALFGAGLVIAMVLGFVLRAFSSRLMLLQAVAIFLAMGSVHNLAFWQPELSTMLFGADWVATQRAEQVPRTVLLGQSVISF